MGEKTGGRGDSAPFPVRDPTPDEIKSAPSGPEPWPEDYSDLDFDALAGEAEAGYDVSGIDPKEGQERARRGRERNLVRQLADWEPIAYDDRSNIGAWCALCDGTTTEPAVGLGPAERGQRGVWHFTTCPWWRARRILEDFGA